MRLIGPVKAVQLSTEWKHKQLLLLINYANSMAKNDPRVSTADYVMGNHGLIVSYAKVKQQVVHIDLWHTKQFQFGMMFSDKSKGTLEYETIGPDLREGEVNIRTVWPDMSKSLETAIQEDIGLPKLIREFGKLLFPLVCVNKWRRGQTQLLPAGTLLSLPGGVAHAGPAGDGFRAVLFFSSSPKGMEEYNPDVQYCKTTIVSDIILYTWGAWIRLTDNIF